MPSRSGVCTSLRISSKVAGRIEITTKSAPVSASFRESRTSYFHRDTASGWALILLPMISFRSAAGRSISYSRTVPHICSSMARSIMKPQAHPRLPPPMYAMFRSSAFCSVLFFICWFLL